MILFPIYGRQSILAAAAVAVILLGGCGATGRGGDSGAAQVQVVDRPSSAGSALLVIDVQNAFLTDRMLKSNKGFFAGLNQVISNFKDHQIHVVYITQIIDESEYRSVKNPGDLADEVKAGPSPVVYSKSRRDAFSNCELHDFLSDNGINTVYIAGLAAEYCVNDTILGALDLGYSVYAIGDCILAEDGRRSLERKLDEYAASGAKIIQATSIIR